jgi:hypothetical protein
MTSTTEIITAIGADAIQMACQVGEFSIRAAKRDGKFPASWFDAIEGLCSDRALPCPRELFAFKRPIEDAKPNQKALAYRGNIMSGGAV